MTELLDAADFLRRTQRRLRFGEFSRLPLKLLRLEWNGASINCDWMMRPADPWDRFIPEHLAEEHQTLQALRDALSLREMVFKAFPRIGNANLRMFRADGESHMELMMTGSVDRFNEVLWRVPSVVMRARMCGFRFTLASGTLKSMDTFSVGY